MPTTGELKEPLLPTSNTKKAKDGGRSKWVTAGAFLCFVAVRSFHPIVIDMSKEGGKLPYGKATPCVINSAVDIVVGNLLAFLTGGVDGFMRCWDPGPLKVFSAIAVAYAFGDFLEMQSMSVMGGSLYQVLLQSKLLVTALIMWGLRGQRQTALQWNVLLTTMIAMSAFMLILEGSSEDGPFKPIGILFVITKVIFSCACAVIAEKYLKAFGDIPIYIQVAQLKFAWLFTSLALVLAFDKGTVANGFFSGWDIRTCFVAASWVCKGWSTFVVLKVLDSVLKNIGEATAIVVIYLMDVVIGAVAESLPNGREFQLSTFLMVLVIVFTILSYTLAPSEKK